MKNREMKPTSILRYEFIQNLTELINNSNLPTYIIDPILRDMYNDIHILDQKQLEIDMKAYYEDEFSCPDSI